MQRWVWGTALTGLLCWPAGVSFAQGISPAPDGTGTQVHRIGNRYDITGGRQAGRNLFHSFGQFNVDTGYIANFLATPHLHNILARVTGGSASYINGLIQVTGGTPNLYLMNPAGIVFGQGASLNVPAAFHATTADRIVFPGGSFHASGVNDYRKLAGEPIGFAFHRKDPAAIVNEGNLRVQPGQSVSLLAGQVVNTGTVQAPGGNITLAAVPGENLVRLSQAGQLLSLEFNPQQAAQMIDREGNISTIRLPELLTGGGVKTVTQNSNGTVSVAGSDVQIPTGTGTAIVSGALDVSRTSQTGGHVGVFGTQIALVKSEVNASGFAGGGEILVGGEFQGKGTQPNAQYTFVSRDSQLTADAIYAGNGGRVIVWADKATDFRGSITAKGGQNAGDGGLVEISGKESLRFTGNVDTSAPKGKAGTLLLDPKNITVINASSAPDDRLLPSIPFDTLPESSLTISNSALLSQLSSNSVTLQATNDIEFNADLTGSGNFTTLSAKAGNNITAMGTIALNNININFEAGNSINTKDIAAGTVNLNAGGSVTTGNITSQLTTEINANSSVTTGNITSSQSRVYIRNRNGDINVGNVTSESSALIWSGDFDLDFNFQYGSSSRPIQIYNSVTFSSNGGNVKTGDITSTRGGDIWVVSAGGNAQTGNLSSTGATSSLKFIDVYASGTVETGFIDTRNPGGIAGDVWLLSESNVRVKGIGPTGFSIDASGSGGAGDILIQYGKSNSFAVGSAAVNGTAGGITNGQFSILPFQEFSSRQLGTVQPGIIRIGLAQNENPLINQILFGTQFFNLDFDLGLDAIEDVALGDFVARFNIAEALSAGNLAAILTLDNLFTGEFDRFLGVDPINNFTSVEAIGSMLSRLAQETGTKPAVVYFMVDDRQLTIAAITPETQAGVARSGWVAATQPLAQREAKAQPVVRGIPEAKRAVLLPVVERFLATLKDPRQRTSNAYLKDAQQLYRWLIAPIEPELQARGIDTLMLAMDAGLRLLPVAALHDGQQFLVEKYNTALIPSVNLVDTRYRNLRNVQVLAMGADTFANQAPLPAVPVELQVITEEWPGRSFLNQDFTVQRLTQERLQGGYPILHLATHADFVPGRLSDSYIEFGNNQRLSLPQLRQLPLREPNVVELLTLSACRTSVGDVNAELGFAGLAVQAGVKSALASLWYVSDEGTLALMSEFYRNLRQAPIKAAALRQAQVAMLQGKVVIKGGELRGVRGGVPVPPAIAQRGDQVLNHPYYWAAFTLVGSPW
ncbi:CHAT domain-containing protein [Gloeomargarita sp.]